MDMNTAREQTRMAVGFRERSDDKKALKKDKTLQGLSM